MWRDSKRLLWFAVALILASALWMLNVELTYEHNVRHIPTNFRERPHNPTHRWRA